MNEMSRLTAIGSSAAERSCQVSPRSVERNSRLPATSAHTTFAAGALSSAVFGIGIGVAEETGPLEADALAAGDAVTVADGALLGDGDALGAFEAGDVQLASKTASASDEALKHVPV